MCGPGYYRNEDSCTECRANTYKEGTNTNTNCTSCPEGTTTNGVSVQKYKSMSKNLWTRQI